MNTTNAPSYKTNDPKGWGGDPRRGAAMGRGAVTGTPVGKLYLRKIRLDSGGYDPNGTYFGWGSPLYWYADADGNVDAMLRADSREGAKQQIREQYPTVQFHR